MSNHKFSSTILVASLIVGCGVDRDDPDLVTDETPRHCVASAVSMETTCFDSFTDAMAFATDGRVVDAPADAADAMVDASFEARLNKAGDSFQPNATVVVAVNFRDGNFTGNTYTFTSDGPCSRSFPLLFPVFESGWNDQISSFLTPTGSNCYEYLYENANYQGGSISGTSMPSMGWYMNDRASTARLYAIN